MAPDSLELINKLKDVSAEFGIPMTTCFMYPERVIVLGLAIENQTPVEFEKIITVLKGSKT